MQTSAQLPQTEVALVAQSEELGPLDEKGITFTATGLTIQPWVKYDQWERYGRKLQLAEKGIQWAIGDWIIFGEDKFGEDYAQAIEVTGLKVKTIQNYAVVAKAIPRSRRRDSDLVDFSTHAEVASLKPDDQEKVLAKAAKEHMSRSKVRREAERIKRDSRPKPEDSTLVLPKEARAFLDEYMDELGKLAERAEVITGGCPPSIQSMIYQHGNRAHWQQKRTRQADYAAIVQVFSFDEGTPGLERAKRDEIAAWLDTCGYHMSDSELNERLDLMVDKKMLEVKSVEDSRHTNQRGSMVDLYALHPDYESELEDKKLAAA